MIYVKMLDDIDHFSNLSPPLCPNELEISIYSQYILPESRTLLLGYTKELYGLCDEAIDLNLPLGSDQKLIQGNWFEIDRFYDTIIGDGVLNLVGGELVEHLSTHCKRLVVRFFTEKIPGMRYATNFRSNTPFLLPDVVIESQPKCKILIWNF